MRQRRAEAGAKVPLRCTLMTGVPLIFGHVGKHAVAQNAGVVDHCVETPEGSRLRSQPCAVRRPSRRRCRLLTTAAPPAATISSTTWWAGETSSPVPSRAPPQVVDDDLRSVPREAQRMLAPNTPASAPVTIAILPSQSRAISPTYEHQRARPEPDCFFPEQRQFTAQGLAV